jgi:hypothetical protein
MGEVMNSTQSNQPDQPEQEGQDVVGGPSVVELIVMMFVQSLAEYSDDFNLTIPTTFVIRASKEDSVTDEAGSYLPVNVLITGMVKGAGGSDEVQGVTGTIVGTPDRFTVTGYKASSGRTRAGKWKRNPR